MDDDPNAALPANLKFLRLLVTGLTGVMIVGLIVVIALLVTRLRDTGPTVPSEITLPQGETARAVTFGGGWVAVVTEANQILIFDALTGALRQTVDIE